jgi:tetratricopeptide (TPR) repeat protein
MKIFSRKTPSKKQASSPAEASESERSFYDQPAGEEPLNEFSGGHERHNLRTSIHSPARRRETSNRAGDKEIFLLFFRTGLILVLLVAGFFALKLGLNKLAEPSEKEKEQWAANAALMEKRQPADVALVGDASSQFLSHEVNAELVGKRLTQWAEAERHMRSAGALDQRGMEDGAISRLKQALHSAPESRAAQQLLMKIYMSEERYAEAVPLCIRLLDQDSQQWGVKTDLLKALQMLDQTEASFALASQMLEKEPNNLDVLSIAARAHRATGNTDEALTLFDRMLQNDRRNLVALEGAGSIYLEREEWAKATPYYLELVEIHSGEKSYHGLVRCYAQQAEAGKAIVAMGQAASLYGDPLVFSWLVHDLEAFDPIRETLEYRSFSERLVGVADRNAIEELRKREIEKQETLPAGLDLPAQPDLKLRPELKPTR